MNRDHMNVLIGTPIHQVKDYCLERWLENVGKLQRASPADLLMVDNSPGTAYIKKVRGYCEKLGIKNYRVAHFEIDQSLGPDVRIERSQEIIRQHVLAHNYDAWFSWECDQIIPAHTLGKLVEMMEMGNFMMVIHNSHARQDVDIVNTNMGITLISKEALKKNQFLPKRKGQISTMVSDSYNIHESIFKKRVLRSGGNFLEVFGIIKPIYHLNE